jgi:hypothetical protein
MFNSLMFYIILGLSATTISLGWLSLSLHDDKVIAVEALKEAKEAVAGYQKALNLKYLSCQIDDASVVEVESSKKDLQTKIEGVSDNIEKLRNPKPQVKQEIIKNESLKESSVLPDDGLLSPRIVQLLKQGYCSAYPTDGECIPK